LAFLRELVFRGDGDFTVRTINWQGVLILVAMIFSAATARGSDAPDESTGGETGTVRVAGVVLKWLRMDKEANFRRGEKMIREAAAGGAKIVATTEGFLDGFMNGDRTIPLSMYHALAERIPGGKYYRRFADLARELEIYLAIGTAEIDAGKTYNTVVFIGPDGKLVGKHRKTKMNRFEAIRDTPGNKATVLDTPYGRFGFRTCYERAFPELVKQTCDGGADYVFLISGGTFGPRNTQMVQARSRENGRHMIFVHPTQFLITGPDGSVLKNETVGGLGKHPPDNFIQRDALNTYAVMRGMLIITEQTGTKVDQNRVVYFDLPLRQAADPSDAR
jgi:predicted amidohydrolase